MNIIKRPVGEKNATVARGSGSTIHGQATDKGSESAPAGKRLPQEYPHAMTGFVSLMRYKRI